VNIGGDRAIAARLRQGHLSAPRPLEMGHDPETFRAQI